eukprot:360454-Chlamydomonas_euryale.AAC.1
MHVNITPHPRSSINTSSFNLRRGLCGRQRPLAAAAVSAVPNQDPQFSVKHGRVLQPQNFSPGCLATDPPLKMVSTDYTWRPETGLRHSEMGSMVRSRSKKSPINRPGRSYWHTWISPTQMSVMLEDDLRIQVYSTGRTFILSYMCEDVRSVCGSQPAEIRGSRRAAGQTGRAPSFWGGHAWVLDPCAWRQKLRLSHVDVGKNFDPTFFVLCKMPAHLDCIMASQHPKFCTISCRMAQVVALGRNV